MAGSIALLLSRAAVVAASFVLLLVAGEVSGRVFVVGGDPRGWSQPTPNDETYNHWAARNRFHIGDFLDFKYAKNDSVLVVSQDDYKFCSGERPEQRFDGGGSARFRLHRNGHFYFISGAPGHCDAGQRMTVRVMSQHGDDAPAPAPSPSPADDDDEGDSGGSFGPPGGSGSGGGGDSSSSSSGSPPPTSTPRGKTSAAAAGVSPSRGGGYRGFAAVAAGVGAVMLVFA